VVGAAADCSGRLRASRDPLPWAQRCPSSRVGLEPAVLAFTFGITAFSVLVFGLGPAFAETRFDVTEIIKAERRAPVAAGGTLPVPADGGRDGARVGVVRWRGLLVRSFVTLSR